MRRSAVIAVAVMTAMLGASAVSASESTVTASVQGSGRLRYLDPTHDVRFSVDAAVTLPAGSTDPMAGDARGTARISHHVPNTPDGPMTIWARIRVDCVVTGGRVATITGEVGDADPVSRRNGWMKQRFGFSVADNGRGAFDRVGWSGPQRRDVPGQPDDPELRRCMAPAPFLAVQTGGYTVTAVG
ncbi:hypothetical protein OHA21_12610 [Actinoplanes sp. NBC_00393]|uniref:hypothetical protein n=1 Tax=Actinoplanes sp. NBC_00393 TaxID=2975953 RepID=UPI002E1A4E9F